MYTFYYNNKTEKLQETKPTLASVYYDVIKSPVPMQIFEEDFDYFRLTGESIQDSIEWALNKNKNVKVVKLRQGINWNDVNSLVELAY